MTAIGIDFGTVSNKIACYYKNGCKILINDSKNPSTPSVAFYLHHDKLFFGERAIKNGHKKSKLFIYDTKILIGEQVSSNSMSEITKKFTFETKRKDNEYKILIDLDNKQQEYSPTDIIGLIIKNLIEISYLNEIKDISPIVISIPALYNSEYIKEMTIASIKAGLSKFYFKSEPILASIAYLSNTYIVNDAKTTIVVFDLGQYYLDVSIIEIYGNNYRIHTERNEEVNSVKFTENIYEYVKIKTNQTSIGEPNINSFFFKECEKAKIILSKLNSTDISIKEETNDDYEIDLSFTLTINDFNKINEELFNKSKETIDKLMKARNVKRGEVDHLFLVGGSTLMKKISEITEEATGRAPNVNTDPREAVALGACIAGSLMCVNENGEDGSQNPYVHNRIIQILLQENCHDQTGQTAENDADFKSASVNEVLKQDTDKEDELNSNSTQLAKNEVSKLRFEFEKIKMINEKVKNYQLIIENYQLKQQYTSLSKNNDKLNQKMNELLQKFIQLHELLGQKSTENKELKKEYNNLICRYYELKQANQSLSSEKKSIEKDHEKEITQIRELFDSNKIFPFSLNISYNQEESLTDYIRTNLIEIKNRYNKKIDDEFTKKKPKTEIKKTIDQFSPDSIPDRKIFKYDDSLWNDSSDPDDFLFDIKYSKKATQYKDTANKCDIKKIIFNEQPPTSNRLDKCETKVDVTTYPHKNAGIYPTSSSRRPTKSSQFSYEYGDQKTNQHTRPNTRIQQTNKQDYSSKKSSYIPKNDPYVCSNKYKK